MKLNTKFVHAYPSLKKAADNHRPHNSDNTYHSDHISSIGLTHFLAKYKRRAVFGFSPWRTNGTPLRHIIFFITLIQNF